MFNFNFYRLFKNNKDSFIVNLYEVFKLIGFTRIDHAKTLLLKYFKTNKKLYDILFP